MRSEYGMFSCMIALFTYISVVPLPCYRTLNVVGDLPTFVTELDLDLSTGEMCIQKECTQERYLSEISYWRFWGMASKSKICLSICCCVFLCFLTEEFIMHDSHDLWAGMKGYYAIPFNEIDPISSTD